MAVNDTCNHTAMMEPPTAKLARTAIICLNTIHLGIYTVVTQKQKPAVPYKKKKQDVKNKKKPSCIIKIKPKKEKNKHDVIRNKNKGCNRKNDSNNNKKMILEIKKIIGTNNKNLEMVEIKVEKTINGE